MSLYPAPAPAPSYHAPSFGASDPQAGAWDQWLRQRILAGDATSLADRGPAEPPEQAAAPSQPGKPAPDKSNGFSLLSKPKPAPKPASGAPSGPTHVRTFIEDYQLVTGLRLSIQDAVRTISMMTPAEKADIKARAHAIRQEQAPWWRRWLWPAFAVATIAGGLWWWFRLR